jgi:hypothetical protein
MQPCNFSENQLLSHLLNKNWRISNLYWIKDKEGRKIKFKPNWAQLTLINDPHPLKLVLKARQLGITTYAAINFLDDILFNPQTHAGIIAHTLDDAQNIFVDKLKYAFDSLDPRIRPLFRNIADSSKELSFTNGSVIRVGTSLRSSTLQRLHISEFGKICAKYPERAREVVTGSLNTVQLGSSQQIIIESTAEGKEGYFYEMCKEALQREKDGIDPTPIQFKLFFFPWWKEDSYSSVYKETLDDYLNNYFAKLHNDNILLTDFQKWWYAAKYKVQKEDMLREYPSTPEEAFQASQDGYWYSQQMKDLHDAGHITNISYDRALPVHVSWDLGQADHMALWFFQVNRAGEVMIIDYFQRQNTPIDQISAILKQKGYSYGIHILPHDANARDRAGITFVQQARPFGITGMVLEQHSLRDGRNLVRSTLNKCWFDMKKCIDGIRALEGYKRKWSSQIGGFKDEDVEDQCCHGADSFRYLCAGLKRIKDSSGSLDSDYRALKNYFGN